MTTGDGLVPQPAPSLDELAATDAMLDQFGALTWGDDGPLTPPSPAPHPSGDRALALLSSLRADVEPEPFVVPAPLAPVVPLRSAGWVRARRLGVAGVVAGAVLSISGVAAAAGAAHPGGTLFGLHRALFGQTASEAAESAVLAELQRARHALHAGNRAAAAEHLRRASERMTEVAGSRRDALAGQVASLQPQLAPAEAAEPATPEQSTSPTARPEPEPSSGAEEPTPSARPKASPDTDDEATTAENDERSDPAPVRSQQRHHSRRHPATRRTPEPRDSASVDEHAVSGDPAVAPSPETGDPTPSTPIQQ